MDLKNKKILVLGSGISGIGAAKLLDKVGAIVSIYDGNKDVDIETLIENLGFEPEIFLGQLKEEILKNQDLVVISPGIPMDIAEVKMIQEEGLPIWGEVELAYRVGKGDVFAITGTNGKTTTTALLGKIMSDYYNEVYIVGNIGTPYTSVADKMTENAKVVAEISSFQLETMVDFKPKASAILNITPDHLNRHHTMEEYIRVKESIVKNQDAKSLCVLNYEDEVLRQFGEKLEIPTVFFSSKRPVNKGYYVEDGKIIDDSQGKKEVLVCLKDLKVLGDHNYENVMAAVALAKAAGVSKESIHKSICEFTAVEHRIEFVKEVEDVAYYNDSKGTNPDAAIKGIGAMNRPTYLIGGGYDKDSDYTEWILSFQGKVRELVLIGQTKEKIAKCARENGFFDIVLLDTLEEAVFYCAKKAKKGEAVLLSPACASWGQFKNYEERGKRFKDYVNQLSK